MRLLTLTGPGGTGKTRLALQAAADQIDRFEDGVFFVDLAAARDARPLLAAIARAIGLTETADQTLLDELSERLRDQHVLLVLDNFEQVTAAAPTVAELLQRVPEAQAAGDQPRGAARARRALVRGPAALLAAAPPANGIRRSSSPSTRRSSCSSSAPRRSGPTSG